MPDPRPDLVFVITDQQRYDTIAALGFPHVDTPNLDGLAANGLRFTQFYNTARCWPTRAALLTGYYAQQVRRDLVPGVASGGRGARPAWARLLPDLLRPLGYRSYHSGKWHVDGMPLQHGFDRSYLLQDQARFFARVQGYVLGAGLAIRRRLLDAFPPLDDGAYEDTILPFRAALLGRVGYVPERLVRYRRHGDNVTHVLHDLSSVAAAMKASQLSLARLTHIAGLRHRDLDHVLQANPARRAEL